MKYELQTIPVWKAFEASPECALCHLERESEERNVGFFLGSSIMAPEMRVKLNERGFCRRHFHMLARGQGKLGYSLALATHFESLAGRFARTEARIAAGGRGSARDAVAYAAELRRQETDCLMCDRIRYNVLNFTYTIAKLFLDDPEFAAALASSKGFCLHHLPAVLEMGADVVPQKRLAVWHETIFELQRRSLAQIGDDLEAFTWQFDYQTEKKTPDQAKDAIPRAVRRLAGFE